MCIGRIVRFNKNENLPILITATIIGDTKHWIGHLKENYKWDRVLSKREQHENRYYQHFSNVEEEQISNKKYNDNKTSPLLPLMNHTSEFCRYHANPGIVMRLLEKNS